MALVAPRLHGPLARFAALSSAGALAGCNVVVMNPAGDVAVQQKNLIIASTALMLLVILPVIALTFIFAWRYRATNPNSEATYEPDWSHSTQVEVVIWTIPLLIIIALGAMTWMATHTLDPYRRLARIGPDRPIAADAKPLEVQVVSLDWKWLFIYPEQGIATVNEMAAPVDRQIAFRITSASVWNTFYVPALAGMIYSMPGMDTKLHAVINQEGEFVGRSAHYSGSGFSRMNFTFRGLSPQDFEGWVAKAKAEGKPLDRDAYLELEKPSEADPVRFYGTAEAGLFDAVLGMCVRPGQMCVHEMHGIDRQGGAAKDSEANRRRLDYDNRFMESGQESPAATFPASGRTPRSETQPQGMKPLGGEGNRGEPNAPRTAPDSGQGNALPGADRTPAPAQLNTRPPERHQH